MHKFIQSSKKSDALYFYLTFYESILFFYLLVDNSLVFKKIKEEDYKGPDWVKCVLCLKWFCSMCNVGSTNPQITCEECENDE